MESTESTTTGNCRRLLTRRNLLRTMACSLAGAAVGGPYYLRSNELETTQLDYRQPSTGSRKSLRLALVTDLHLRGSLKDYVSLSATIRDAAPDLIAICGDTVDHEEALPLIEFLGDIDAPLGKIATLGNWEHNSVEIAELRKRYAAVDVQLAVNETIERGGWQFVCVDDWKRGQPDLDLAVDRTRAGPTIVLSHCPTFFDDVLEVLPRESRENLLMLSGHTHGGQVAPFGFAPYTPAGSGRFVSGWYREDGASLYVSRGVGYSGLAIRIGARPELAFIDLV